MPEIERQLQEIVKKNNVLKNEPMAKHTSFKVGGIADYFVKVTDGAVNVYWYEGDEKNLYRETDIEFSLLSAEDQKLLETGIRLENEQELAGFLENFDS